MRDAEGATCICNGLTAWEDTGGGVASDLLMLRIFTVSVQNNCTKFVNNTEEKYFLPPSLPLSLPPFLPHQNSYSPRALASPPPRRGH